MVSSKILCVISRRPLNYACLHLIDLFWPEANPCVKKLWSKLSLLFSCVKPFSFDQFTVSLNAMDTNDWDNTLIFGNTYKFMRKSSFRWNAIVAGLCSQSFSEAGQIISFSKIQSTTSRGAQSRRPLHKKLVVCCLMSIWEQNVCRTLLSTYGKRYYGPYSESYSGY